MPDTGAVRLRIEKLVAGGDGLAFLEGKAVFVPFTLPGETVLAKITAVKKDYAQATLVEVLEPSRHRVDPPCPIYGQCGGCNLQHLSYSRQVEEKALIVAEAFERTGGVEPGEIAAVPSLPFSYRNRMQLHFTKDRRLGFMKRFSSEVVEAPSCLIALRSIQDWIEERAGSSKAYDELANASTPTNSGLANASPSTNSGLANASPSTNSGLANASTPTNSRLANASPSTNSWLAKDRFIVFGYGDEVWVEGERGIVEVAVSRQPIRFHIRGFFQSNLYLLDYFVPDTVAGLSGRRAADLYCGVGLFSHFLASAYESIVCVEHNPYAIEIAKSNVAGQLHEFHSLSVEDWVRTDSAKKPFDLVLVDPPRAGLAVSVRAWLAKAKPPVIVYVSCDPVTLARDARDLTAAGYALQSLKAFDFYPQTSHVECNARFVLR